MKVFDPLRSLWEWLCSLVYAVFADEYERPPEPAKRALPVRKKSGARRKAVKKKASRKKSSSKSSSRKKK